MRNKGFILSSLTLTVIWFVAGCSQNATEENVSCGGVTVSFATEVNPIIQANCATNSSCHASGSNHSPGPLTTYSQIYSARYSVRSSVASGSMPQNGTLTSAQKNAIICWVENGATNN